MRGWIRFAAIGAAVLAACKFNPNGATSDGKQAVGSDASVPSDAPIDGPPDADLACGVAPSCVDSNTLNACVGSQGSAQNVPCAWGCLGSDAFSNVPHCAEMVPSGGIATAADAIGSDVGATTLPDGATLDTRDGTITNGPTTIRAAGTGVKSGIDFESRTTGAVFRFGALTINGALSFAYDGGHNVPVALVSTSTIIVNGAIDAENCGNAGVGGPGGFRGAGGHATASGSGGGGGGGATDKAQGGGGGGYGNAGGAGGDDDGTTAAAGGPAFGDPTLAVLVGGGGGGGGGNDGNAFGGGGGGGIQLVANGALTFNSGGSISAGGCGGTGGSDSGAPNPGGGGGGGAGGAILLEGHDITINGTLAVNGGGGGAGASPMGNANTGANGVLGRSGALGSQMSDANAFGGPGAYANNTVGVVSAGAGDHASGFGGGGGGGIGRMRFNTRSGTATVNSGAVLSPNLTDANTTCTQGVANTQ